ncbi:MAG: hypothetical protein IKD04_08020 [Clostridia bacterium]|nr:hypothetical protein [Clostridia bacterium]
MKKITVVGGDNRLKIVKEKLEAGGYAVDTLGLYPEESGDIKSSQIVVLPVPTTKDGLNVFTPLSHRKIPLSYISENTASHQLILSCNYLFEGRQCVDYGSLDSYALLNSVPTAEGAIKLAIENTPYTLWKSSVLVIGYGRVGKLLADRLKAFGCNVTVSARKPADFAMLEALGFSYINTEQLSSVPLNYQIIFNTVDVEVIANEALEKCSSDLIIDLSTKGGLSLKFAEECGIKALKAPGLPGLIAPKTAAEILCNTLTYIINSYN